MILTEGFPPEHLALLNSPACVYGIFDSAGKLIYSGVTKHCDDPEKRWTVAMRLRKFGQPTTIRSLFKDTRYVCLKLEAFLVSMIASEYNILPGGGRFWKKGHPLPDDCLLELIDRMEISG
jgi:hypothetical protein